MSTLSHVSPQDGTLEVHGKLDTDLLHCPVLNEINSGSDPRVRRNNTGQVRVPDRGHGPQEPE